MLGHSPGFLNNKKSSQISEIYLKYDQAFTACAGLQEKNVKNFEYDCILNSSKASGSGLPWWRSRWHSAC